MALEPILTRGEDAAAGWFGRGHSGSFPIPQLPERRQFGLLLRGAFGGAVGEPFEQQCKLGAVDFLIPIRCGNLRE